MERPNKKRVRSLIVEDDQSSRNTLSKILERSGYDVTCAVSVAEALPLLNWHPRTLILDLLLPDGSGVDVLQRIRSENLPIRVAVVTGASDPTLLQQVQQLHPEAVFQKPLDVRALMRWLETGN